MERMITKGSPHITLRLQNRMRTEFVPLLSHFYPGLESNPCVDDRAPPACMSNSFCFWAHHGIETFDKGGVISNIVEAEMCAFIASWLAWNSEVAGKDITVLALYKGTFFFLFFMCYINDVEGQVNLIKNKLLRMSEDLQISMAYREALANIYVGTVDNFQGAENR